MPIQNLGPGEIGRRGLDQAQDAIELARSKRDSAPGGVGDAAGTELHKTGAAEGAQTGGSTARSADESRAGDRVELSLVARALSAGEDPTVAARRSEQVAQMKSAIDAGTLTTPERIERAAQRLLGG